MKLSFSTLGCPRMSFGDILAIAKDLSYDGIEIRGVMHVIDAPDIREFSPEKREKTMARLKELGLAIPILTSACDLHVPARWEADFAMAKRYVDMAKAMNIPYVRMLADRNPAPEGEVDDALVAANLSAICGYAAAQGVEILVETNGVYADTARLRKLIDAVNQPNLGVLWDFNHPYRFFGEAPETTMENIGALVKHCHVKDSEMQDGEMAYCMVGYGDVPVKKCIALLKQSGYDGYFSLEWVKRWNMSLEEPGIAFAKYAGFMRNL